jgi:hypothetical protein
MCRLAGAHVRSHGPARHARREHRYRGDDTRRSPGPLHELAALDHDEPDEIGALTTIISERDERDDMPVTSTAAPAAQKLKTTITATSIRFEGQVKSTALSDRIKNVPKGSALKLRMQTHRWAVGAGKEKTYQFVIQRLEGVDPKTKKEKWKDVVSKSVKIGTAEFKFESKLDALGKGDYRVKLVLRPALGAALAVAGSVYAAPMRGSENASSNAPAAGSPECFDAHEEYSADELGSDEPSAEDVSNDEGQDLQDPTETTEGDGEYSMDASGDEQDPGSEPCYSSEPEAEEPAEMEASEDHEAGAGDDATDGVCDPASTSEGDYAADEASASEDAGDQEQLSDAM